MKKTLFIYLVICALIFNNCIEKIERDDDKDLFFLIRGTPAEISLWEEAVNVFMKKNKDIEVQMEYVPYNEYWSKIETMMAGGSAPDVVFMESTRMASFINLDALLPLDDYIKEDSEFKKKNYYPQAINSYIHQNKLYGIPNDIAIYALYYNKNIFDQKGISYPKKRLTWNSFLKICKQLTEDKDNDGTTDVYGFNVGWTYFLWLWQAGADYYNNPKDPTHVTINSSYTKKAMQFLKDMIYKHKVSPTFAQASSIGDSAKIFMTGKSAMIIEGHWLVPQFKSIKDFKWDVTYLPVMSTSTKGANYNAGSCFAVPRLSKNQEKAWRLIKFLAGDEGQEILVSGGFSTPALRTKKITDIFLKSTPPDNNKVFLEMIKEAHLPPMISEYNQINNMMYNQLDYIWLDIKPINKVVPQIAKELKKYL